MYLYNTENYKANDKGQSQVVFKEIYKEGTYLNSAHYRVNDPRLDNDWACQESEWGIGVNVGVNKLDITATVRKPHFQTEEKEVFELNFWKTFGTKRSTSVDVCVDREQLETIIEQAQKLLEK